MKLGTPIYLDPNVPVDQAAELDDMPLDDMGHDDVFIDDDIAIVPNIAENWKRGSNTMPLAIHALWHPLAPDESLPHGNPLLLSKLKAEGTMTESLLILRWQFNLQSLQVTPPLDKYVAWSSGISTIISNQKASMDNLESLLGRLNHVAMVLPLPHYFLNRIRHFITNIMKLSNSNLCTPSRKRLSTAVRDAIQLFQTVFIPKVQNGISMNLITF
jgi:hypothetical protein